MKPDSDHNHEGFDVPDDHVDPQGRTDIDHKVLSDFIGAAFDGCVTCQDAHLTVMVEDPPTVARLVELACVATHAALGGLPRTLTDPAAGGPATPEFRRLATAGLDGAHQRMRDECTAMTPTERRAAANTAADILIGQLGLAGPG